MTFRIALAALAVITASGAAQAQPLQPRLVDRVVVDIGRRPMPAVRADLARASEAVCRTADTLMTGRDDTCVSATYARALVQAKLVRSAAAGTPTPTRVASR